MHYFDNEAAWEAFRAEAESWLGTPYRHLQRCKGRGADCTLFVGQALLDAGLLTRLEYDYYPRDWHEHTRDEYVLEASHRHMRDYSASGVGDGLPACGYAAPAGRLAGVFHYGTPRDQPLRSGLALRRRRVSDAARHQRPGRIVYAARELVAEAHDPALPHRHCRSGGGRMGVGLIIAAVTIGATVATTLFAKGPRSTKGADMAPANLDAFRLTTAEEGTVIPRVFGTVRLPGNLLYYGNLSSEPEYEETTVGGKGGKKKKQKVLQGYHYRMDVWQGIGMGPLELVGVYQDDRLLTEQGGAISCAEQVWNNGTGAFYPAQAGPYASRLPGVSHIWLRQFYLGFNVSMMPTLHYVVRFCGDIPLEHAILSNGVNPAAIILQLLLDAGASWSSIDKPSFSAAASFWAQKGYGLNIVFSRQKPVRDHIMQVLGAVGGWLIERADGTLSLRAPDPDVAPSATLGEGDFLEGSFSFKRAAWDTTWNDLSGKFTDAAQDYSERAVTANNAASIQLLGLRRKKSVDLTAFTDRGAAQRRIEELRDVESYPAASFSFDVSRDYAHIEQGQILEITHSRFGLSGVRVRVLEVVRGNLSENRISIQARQVVERLSGMFVPPGETLPDPMAPPTVVYPPVTGIPPWSAPDLSPVPLRHARLFELPRNPETGSEPVVLVLAARELLSEEGVLVERSATNADYSPVGLLSAPWAQYGTLAEAYPASTLAVDDTQGLLYRPYKEDPSFGPVSRTDLFGARRMALVGDELMLFQTVVLEGSETTRLSGVVRGYMNTPVQAHASGAAIWVFRNPGEGNTVQGLPIGTHNIKLRPVSGDEVLGADRVDRLSLAVTGKAMVPWPVAGLRAVRTGDSVAVSWSPVDVAFGGAGTRTEKENEPVPAGFSGDFVLTAAGTEHVVNGTSITLTRSGRFALSVTARQLGYVSPAAYVTVESQDGEYVA